MAGALVGGAFLSAFLQVLFDRLASRNFLELFRGQKLSEKLLRKLKIALLSVNAVLEDAEEKELTNPTVKEWLDELKDAVYDAEDILDEIATKVQTDVKKAIEDVLGSLEFLAKQKDVIGLREGVGVRPSQRLPTTSYVEKSATFGRDDEKEAVINSLLSDDASGNENENMRVIAIVGMGGIGKTTLAQLVYNDKRVKDYFKLEAWICVSYEFDVLKVTNTILEAVTSRTWDIQDLDLLQKKLRQKLKGKKFLFVLDDVWNEIYAYWELLSNAFQSGAPGSTVIVTSRSENVASTMRTIKTHYLKELPEEYCWPIFAKHAFRSGESDSYPELKKIGKQIVGKCKGLPLAAKAIGALLWSKRDANEWNQVSKSELWDLPNDGRNILPALRLSYKYLPSHLKRCFAYCSIFPKGHIFEKDELVLLWMAEGFLQQSINKTMEEVGDEYFLDLVSRSLFQQLSGDSSGFVMHHLVNDLAIFVSGQLSFRLDDDYTNQIVYKTRHLSYLRTRFGEKFEALNKAKQLRTFLLLASSCTSDVYAIRKVLPKLLSMLKCLRVLSFSQCSNIIELSDSIGNIIHLRYLDLSCTAVKTLPASVCKLWNLQTLKLSSCVELVELPGDLQELINLRHLDLSLTPLQCLPVSICSLSNLQTLKVSNCKNLIALPREIEKLTNLRCLDLSSTAVKRLPDSICELWNLQTLKCCADLVDLPTNVRKLINLRHLDLSLNGLLQCLPDSICELCNLQTLKLTDCIKLPALPKEIQKLTNLSHLDISGTGIKEMPIELSRLKCLQMLTTFIVGKDSGSPIQELGQLVNLRGKLSILELQNVKLSTVEAVLKYMNYLEELVLEWNDSNTSSSKSQRNEKIVFDSLKPHTNLKSLVLKYYGGECFPDWVGDPSFSNIASLRLENCKYCCTLPPLGQLPSLKDLSIVGFEGVVKVDCEFYGNRSSSFGALKVLRFENLLKWVDWSSFGVNEGEAFPQLEELYIFNCPNLSGGMPAHLTRLAKLEINECMQLVAPLSSARTGCEMRLTRCNEALLEDLPSGMRLLLVAGVDALVYFPKEIMGSNSCLQELRIYNCSSLMYLSGGGLPSTLKYLKVEFCEKLELPMQLNCPFLEKLHLTKSCGFLKSFQLEVFPKLYEIKIHGCKNLESLTVPELYEDNLVIVEIEIKDCPNFVSFPKGGLRAPKLTSFLVANCGSLRSLPDKMHTFLPSLKNLRIQNCPEIESFPEGGLPSQLNLGSIHIIGCEKLVAVWRG